MYDKNIITDDDKRWLNKIWFQHYEILERYIFYGEVGSWKDRTVICLGNARTRDEMWARYDWLKAIIAKHNPPLAINILNEINGVKK